MNAAPRHAPPAEPTPRLESASPCPVAPAVAGGVRLPDATALREEVQRLEERLAVCQATISTLALENAGLARRLGARNRRLLQVAALLVEPLESP